MAILVDYANEQISPAPPHEQLAFMRLKQAICDMHVQLREFGEANTHTSKPHRRKKEDKDENVGPMIYCISRIELKNKLRDGIRM